MAFPLMPLLFAKVFNLPDSNAISKLAGCQEAWQVQGHPSWTFGTLNPVNYPGNFIAAEKVQKTFLC